MQFSSPQLDSQNSSQLSHLDFLQITSSLTCLPPHVFSSFLLHLWGSSSRLYPLLALLHSRHSRLTRGDPSSCPFLQNAYLRQIFDFCAFPALLQGVYPIELCSPKSKNVHHGPSCDGPKVETTQMPIEESAVACAFSDIQCSR